MVGSTANGYGYIIFSLKQKGFNTLIVRSCVRCGMCCTIAPCGFGEWSSKERKCKFLSFSKRGRARCDKYYEIIKDPSSKFSPAFGSGCCSPIGNERRVEMIMKFYEGRVPTHEID